MPAQNIKKIFKRRMQLFYIWSFIVVVVLSLALYFAKQYGFYTPAFIVVVLLFLLWIFNADKIYRCPNCNQSPRGKEGLIYLPRHCASCEVELR